MDNIKAIIQQVIEKIAPSSIPSQEKIEHIWQKVLGKEQLKHTRLVGIKEGCISVLVDSPVWLYQMRISKGRILGELKKEMSGIKDIYLKIGKVS